MRLCLNRIWKDKGFFSKQTMVSYLTAAGVPNWDENKLRWVRYHRPRNDFDDTLVVLFPNHVMIIPYFSSRPSSPGYWYAANLGKFFFVFFLRTRNTILFHKILVSALLFPIQNYSIVIL